MAEEMNPLPDLRLWGKMRGLDRPYPVLWHLIDAAAIAGCLWDLYLSESQRSLISVGLGVSATHARALVAFWAGLHDIGKITPGFQCQDPAAYAPLRDDPEFPPAIATVPRLRHDMASQLVGVEQFRELGHDSGSGGTFNGCYRAAQLLGGHHGWFESSADRTVRRLSGALGPLGQAGWRSQRAAHFAAVYEAVGRPAPPAIASPPEQMLGAAVASTLTGLIILADWLASQEWFLKSQVPHLSVDGSAGSIREHLDRTSSVAPDVLRRAGLGQLRIRERGFVDVFGFAPNPLQQSVIDELIGRLDGPGLLVVTAATGDGKTEVGLIAATALAQASGVDGLHFGLPTMATADQMYARVADFTGKVATGPAPVTLLHSMSWLNAEYTARAENGLAEPSPTVSSDGDATVAASDWLRGSKRGLLASMSAGTIDQALMAALASKHNALRMLGLSRKVLVVDEAHAYDAYMQAILRQLLCWLGALGAPVILLSATLPSTVSGSLVAAYLRGSGRGSTDQTPWTVDYPGWLFVPARADQEPVRISPRAAAAVAAHRTLDLAVDVRPVSRTTTGGLPTDDVDDRMSVIRAVLEPVTSQGGCVAIICNTVAEAQQTYADLRDNHDGVEVTLLHARFPALVREQKTAAIVDALGRRSAEEGRRPRALIVIATQVIEQSLDLDFDLVISDLSPIAQLLQRAGRCHRHKPTQPRPSWAATPRLVVLDPHGTSGYAKPKAWGSVYSDYLLRATHLLLAGRAGAPVCIPGDVQGLVEAVYVHGAGADSFLNDAILDDERLAHIGDEFAQKDMAGYVTLPDPANIMDLAELSNKQVDEAKATTRLGADSIRVLCCYVDDHGDRWLDPELTHHRLPETGSRADGGFRPDEVRDLLARTIPMRDDEINDEPAPEYQPPPKWADNPWLSKLALLPHRATASGVQPVHLGRHAYMFSSDLGLCRVA